MKSVLLNVIRGLDPFMVNDQALLAHVAKRAVNPRVCIAAADKLNDKELAQKVFFDIVKNSDCKSKELWKKAIEKLNDQSLLVDIAESNLIPEIRMSALRKIANTKLIDEITEKHPILLKKLEKEKMMLEIKVGQSLSEIVSILGSSYSDSRDSVSKLFGNQTGREVSFGRRYLTWSRPEGKWKLVFENDILVQIYERPSSQ